MKTTLTSDAYDQAEYPAEMPVRLEKGCLGTCNREQGSGRDGVSARGRTYAAGLVTHDRSRVGCADGFDAMDAVF